MATCISRRACADRDTLRLIDKDGQPGRHIWVEYRCSNKVIVEGLVCRDCAYKLPKYKYQANAKCDHGIIGGPYPADSKLYGSGFYLKLIKEGWKILEADENRAKAAVDKANSEMAKKMLAKPSVEKEAPVVGQEAPVVGQEAPVVGQEAPVVGQEAPVVGQEAQVIEQPVRQKRAYKKRTPEEKAAKAVKPVKAVETANEIDTKKLKTIKRVKSSSLKLDILLPTPPPIEEIPHDPKFIESISPPINIGEFVTVKVKKIKCQAKDYYYDANSGKLYGISVNGVGGYKGRYNVEKDIVDTTFPDSDVEEEV
uniref:Uncharacterized protein n=1 Tax=viral metagenome TaxID=1070528 RepID=A0A6C0APK5_9ZZZZ